MLRLVLILSLLVSFVSKGQGFITPTDSLNKKRLTGISIGIGTVWAGSMIGLSQVWYRNVAHSEFHTFDDCKNWLQMDKAGHFYTANKLNKLNYDLLHWSGLEHKKSVWLSAGVSVGYQTTLEFFDAFSSDWGFSWCDVTANMLGTATFTVQELLWKEERIIPKFSYHPTQFAELRPEVLGSNFAESLLKDYNGQTYWLSFSPGTFMKNRYFPKWACVSLGYSVTSKIVGDQETYTDPLSWKHYEARRQFLLSLDIDFSQLEIRRPWIRAVVRQFNYLKIPFPALMFEAGRFGMAPVYF